MRVKVKANRAAEGKALWPKHKQHLLGSGITPKVIGDRGYFTAQCQHELQGLGFSANQAKTVPALVIPIWGVSGKIVSYQIRPDFPRTSGERVSKYEIPFGGHNSLDVPRGAYKDLNNKEVPLWITEGIKKADAAVSNGLCCIALIGVWSWLSKVGKADSLPIDDWNYLTLGHRRVYICFDSDVMTNPKVAQALRQLKTFLRSRNATVISIFLPSDEGKKVGLDDFLASGGTVEDLYTFTKASTSVLGPGGIRSDLPTIKTHNIQLAPNVDEALKAIVEANEPPNVFDYSGKLTRLRVDETNLRDVPRLEMMSKDAVVNHLSRVANFVSISQRGKMSVNPPDIVARMLMSHSKWPEIPKLNGIVTSPIFNHEGTLCSIPGYDSASQMIYYERTSLKLGDLTPTSKNIHLALRLFDNLLIDFPFADVASKAHAIGFLLLPFVREMIDGPTPLHLFDAPRAGTGKSLLMSVLSTVFIPRGVFLQAAPKEEEEWRKRLTTILREGSSHCLFDNIRDLSSESLQAALTAPDCLWKDRLLGGNDILSLPIRCVWAATANNITGTIEQLRRCVQIRIDSKTESPEERTDFKHPDIRAWVRENRHRTLESVLVVVRLWIEQGRPNYSGKNGTMGSFENWTNVIGGILETAGIQGFLDNRKSFTVQSDTDRDTIRGLTSDWYKQFGQKPTKAKDLIPLARRYFDLGEADVRIQSIKLGKILSSYRDNVIGGYVLIIKPTDSGALYRLEPTEETKP